MAAADQLQDLREEATCSICLEYFKDPVSIECGHNFCRSCITQCWEGSAPNFPCPQCRETSAGGNLRPNRQLGNVVEIARKLQISTVKPQEGNLCHKHEEKLKLFCKDDQKLICLVCSMSLDHTSHTMRPIEEAAEEYKVKLQDWLHPLRKEMEEILKSKLKEEEEYKTLRNTLETERQNIVAEFERLRQLLEEQEQTLLRRLEEMDTNITMAENAKITKLSHQITSLSALITEIKEKCKEPAEQLLEDVRSTLSRCNVKFQKPEKQMEINKREEKCVDKLKIQKPEEHMKNYKATTRKSRETFVTSSSSTLDLVSLFGGMVKQSRTCSKEKQHKQKRGLKYRASDKTFPAELDLRGRFITCKVTLDPDSAHPELVLSEERRRVRGADRAQPLPDNPGRFTGAWPCVLGSEGFTSGRHYWELQLLQEGGAWWVGKGWSVGVAGESVSRKGEITWSPEGGVWAVRGCNGQYSALTSPPSPLSSRERPQKLGVYLDYEGGRLSLYNADTMEHLCTFPRAPFTQRLFPFVCLWGGAELSLV